MLKSESMSLNGYRAHRRAAEFIEEGTEGAGRKGLHVISTFIQKENKIYAFHGFTDLDHVRTYESSLLFPMDNLRNLTDRGRLNVQPARVRIKRTTRRETLQEALRRLGVKDSEHQNTAILNGMLLTDALQPDTILKIME